MRTTTAPAKKGAAEKTTATAKKTTGTASKAITQDSDSNGTGTEAPKQTPFEKLFEDLLKDIYWAEQHLVDALKKMQAAATTTELQDAFEDHMYTTQKHVSRLEKIFGLLGTEAEAKKCDAMAGLIKEANHIIEETKAGTMTRDAALIIAAQKVEHYEIASYGSLVQVALTLGHDEVAMILERTLREEEDTDSLLTEIAETDVNPMADDEDEDTEDTATDAAAAGSDAITA